MVRYADDDVFPAPRAAVWKLLAAHQKDELIHAIHPLVLHQTTVQPGSPESIVERVIDVRGKPMRSRWKLTNRPPEYARWEILESEGPWSPGSYVENQYGEVPGGTRIVTRADLHVKVLPFFFLQGMVIRKVLGDIDVEDRVFLDQMIP
jgi:hypothetical protein